jgi:hypothetical protein
MLTKLGISDLSEEVDGTLLPVAGQTGPDGWDSDGRLGWRRLRTHGDPSRKRWCQGGRGAS